MHIAYLTGEYPRATDTFIQREVQFLRQKGLTVSTFSVRRTGDEHIVGLEQEEERKNTFYVLPPNLINLLYCHLYLIFRFPLRYIKAIILAWETRSKGLKGFFYQIFYFLEAGIIAYQIKVKNIQHLHNHIPESSGNVALLASELGGFSFSFTIHGPSIFFQPYRWHLSKKIEKALFVVCISHFCRSQCMYFSSPSHWKKMSIIHCGVDPSLFSLKKHEKEGKNLLYVGRLSPEKGLPILLQSLVSLSSHFLDLSLTVVGDGFYRYELEKLTYDLNISKVVNFVGYKSQIEVRQYLHNTDIFVLPSFAEGVPVVLMEAMASGLPVVASHIAGIPELVENGVSGYLVPPGDVNTLCDRIHSLIINPELRNSFGTEGRKKVEKEFNLTLEIERLYSLFIDNL